MSLSLLVGRTVTFLLWLSVIWVSSSRCLALAYGLWYLLIIPMCFDALKTSNRPFNNRTSKSEGTDEITNCVFKHTKYVLEFNSSVFNLIFYS